MFTPTCLHFDTFTFYTFLLTYFYASIYLYSHTQHLNIFTFLYVDTPICLDSYVFRLTCLRSQCLHFSMFMLPYVFAPICLCSWLPICLYSGMFILWYVYNPIYLHSHMFTLWTACLLSNYLQWFTTYKTTFYDLCCCFLLLLIILPLNRCLNVNKYGRRTLFIVRSMKDWLETISSTSFRHCHTTVSPDLGGQCGSD